MTETSNALTFTREALEADLVTILTEMTVDWDIADNSGITGETRLMADLSFESIDVVQLVVQIEAHVQRRHLHFEQLLMVDGRYVQELQVKDIAEFLAKQLAV